VPFIKAEFYSPGNANLNRWIVIKTTNVISVFRLLYTLNAYQEKYAKERMEYLPEHLKPFVKFSISPTNKSKIKGFFEYFKNIDYVNDQIKNMLGSLEDRNKFSEKDTKIILSSINRYIDKWG
jgi:hypothetical protein